MVFEDVRDIIAEQLDINKDKIKIDTNLQEELNVDSLDAIDIIYDCEEKFGITVPDESIEHFKTVKEIVDYIEQNK